ncbi:MAG: hypothetical protein JNL57_14030 [Bacteroidetes bacterium]|nr:hypothetical protein [Bacteroidota bacterium]
MKLKPFLIGGLAAAVAGFFLGFLWYAVLFDGYYKTDVSELISKGEGEMNYFFLVGGFVVSGLAMAYLYSRTDLPYTMGTGFLFGAVAGMLPGLGAALTAYATSKVISLQGIGMETLWGIVCFGTMGAIIAKAYDRYDE